MVKEKERDKKTKQITNIRNEKKEHLYKFYVN